MKKIKRTTIFLFEENIETLKKISLCKKYQGQYQTLAREIIDASLKDKDFLKKLGIK